METTESPPDSGKAARPQDPRLGRYRLGARIGRGGAASVHLGLVPGPEGSQKRVAVKLIHDHLAEETQFVAMFLDEAHIAVRLEHPNIVRAYELGKDDGKLYLVMEYLHGQPLHRLFFRGFRNGRKLSLDMVAWIGACVARGLHYAHNLTAEDGTPLGLVHRDVSPRNVFINYDGTVKLIDFGIARAEGRLARTKVGQMKGTFSYIAPERALGGGCDHRADLFSLGAVLFEAAVGHRLFRGEDDVQTLSNILKGKIPDPRSIRPDVPEELVGILYRALAMRPEDRFASGEELALALESFVHKCGEPEPQRRLADLMQVLFAAERQTQEGAMTALETDEEPSTEDVGDDSGMAVVSTNSRTLSAIAARAPRVARFAMVATAALSTVALVAYFAARWAVLEQTTHATAAAAAAAAQPPSAEPYSAASVPAAVESSAAPAAQQVNLQVEVQPTVDAQVEVDGTPLGTRPYKIAMERGEGPVTVRVRADGYEDAVVAVVPDENRIVSVVLREAPRSAPEEASRRGDSSHSTRARAKYGRDDSSTLGDMLNRRH